MSLASSVSSPFEAERRSHARRRIEGLAYVDFGPDNGAILIDLGEGGLGFQSVAPVSLEQAVLLKFKLPGGTGFIESYAEIVWLNESGKGGGLRFAELSAEARLQIRAWTGVLSIPDVSAETPQGATGSDAIAANGAAAKNASAMIIGESPSPESIPPTAPAPLFEEVLESLANADGGATERHSPETADAALAAEISGELAAGEPNALPIPQAIDNSEATVLPELNVAAEARQVESMPAPAARRRVAENRAAPEPIDPGIRPVINPASKAVRMGAGSPSESVTSRLRSGLVAASKSFAPEGPAVPPKGRAPASQATNSAPAQKCEQPPATSQRRSPLPPPYRDDAPIPASLIRQPQTPGPANPNWDKMPVAEERAPRAEETLAAQARKIGIAAAAGATLVLALVAAVPSLRTRVQAIVSARSAGSNLLPDANEFQVEVADLNNRRWILKSGGDAGSPFSAVGRRIAGTSAHNEASGALSRSNDSGNSGNAPDTPRPRTAKPGELALARPRATQAAGAPVQVLAPSIFDSITPPIGSLSDRLPVTGPDAPGPVQPSARGRAANLQAAVLVQRVAPVYPNLALQQRVRGEVRVSATIAKDGVPKNLKAIAGDQRLIPAALAAISQWRYRPATLDGEPIETQTTVSVSFELN
jgi:TonB family protein